jgi:hypothetical protein
VFKPTYLQAVADGFSSDVATAAAQSAMDDCLAQRAVVTPTVQAMVNVPQDRLTDSGPTSGGPADRSATLGTRQK